MRQETIEALRKEFPGKTIICIPNEENPTEVIVELSHDENESVAIAIIDRSAPHFHRVITEMYEIESGSLILYFDNIPFHLKEGARMDVIISPNTIHWAEGDETRVRVTATPPWTPEDHILLEDFILATM